MKYFSLDFEEYLVLEDLDLVYLEEKWERDERISGI